VTALAVVTLAIGAHAAAPPAPAAERPRQRVETAEARASEAIRLAAERPQQAVALARGAFDLTLDFEPTAFVDAGRKGEVVEDAYLAARAAYRLHRARLYEAVGESLLRAGSPQAAVRYLRRAVHLAGGGERRARLARALVELGRGQEALAEILSGDLQTPGPEAIAAAGAAADLLGLPSLQVELDRARVARLSAEAGVSHRYGPLRPPERSRLSTGAPLRLDEEGVSFVYVSDVACRSCSADLTLIRDASASRGRALVLPRDPDEDAVVRRIMESYRLAWPVILFPRDAPRPDLPAPSVAVLARRGWSVFVALPPLDRSLAAVLPLVAARDVAETIPRSGWNGRPPAPIPAPPLPRPFLPGGLAPGEDEPAPARFEEAVSAFREGRFADAMARIEKLEAAGDGWLLPPEARLNRALCLARMGRREAARRLLLQTGDSRLQEAVDRAVEAADETPSATRP
jgi:tetratricopeptide (TPR) repeat protein